MKKKSQTTLALTAIGILLVVAWLFQPSRSYIRQQLSRQSWFQDLSHRIAFGRAVVGNRIESPRSEELKEVAVGRENNRTREAAVNYILTSLSQIPPSKISQILKTDESREICNSNAGSCASELANLGDLKMNWIPVDPFLADDDMGTGYIIELQNQSLTVRSSYAELGVTIKSSIELSSE